MITRRDFLGAALGGGLAAAGCGHRAPALGRGLPRPGATHLWVADRAAHRVTGLDRNGLRVVELELPVPTRLASAPGRLWVASAAELHPAARHLLLEVEVSADGRRAGELRRVGIGPCLALVTGRAQSSASAARGEGHSADRPNGPGAVLVEELPGRIASSRSWPGHSRLARVATTVLPRHPGEPAVRGPAYPRPVCAVDLVGGAHDAPWWIDGGGVVHRGMLAGAAIPDVATTGSVVGGAKGSGTQAQGTEAVGPASSRTGVGNTLLGVRLVTDGPRRAWVLARMERGGLVGRLRSDGNGDDATPPRWLWVRWLELSPGAAVCDGEGGLWIADHRRPWLERYDAGGQRLLRRRDLAGGGIEDCLALDGALWLAAGGAVLRVDRSGATLPGQGGFHHAVSLAAHLSGAGWD